MDAFDPTVLPQFVERKGSLSLRSDHTKYGRATLISNWHQDRESEPKDYDIGANFDDRNLHKATYHHLATDKVKFETTTQASMDEIKLKKDFETRDTTRKMITAENALTNTQRDTGAPVRGHGSVLPRHHPDHDKRRLYTTHKVDYKNPWPNWSPSSESQSGNDEEISKADTANRRTLSEFTDTANHRRGGWNTWQDDIGQ